MAEIRQFPGVAAAGMVWIPLGDPDNGSWWVLSGDGVSYWEGPDAIREHAAGLVADGIDESEPGIADGYRLLADLITRLMGEEAS